jgi:predicted porin
LAATSAFAQSSVTAYGLVDVAHKAYDVTAGTGAVLVKAKGVSDGANAGNRIGFKGTEDLGNATTANFLMEFGFTPTDRAGLSERAAAEGAQMYGVSNSGNIPLGAYSSSASLMRQAYVGLSGSVGEIRGGYQYTNAYDLSTNAGYMVGQEQPGGFLHKMNQSDMGDARANSITYISPAFSGVTAQVQYGGGPATTRNTTFQTDTAAGLDGYKVASAKRTSIMLTWANGPAKASYAYTDYKEQTVAGTTTQSYNQFYAPLASAAADADNEFKLNQLGASYDFGVAKLAGTYLSAKKTNNLNADLNLEYKAYQVGALLPIPSTKATAYVMTGSGDVTTAATGVKANDYSSTQYGVRYAFSPRTTAYVTHGESKDKAVAATSASAARSVYTAVGLAHSF